MAIIYIKMNKGGVSTDRISITTWNGIDIVSGTDLSDIYDASLSFSQQFIDGFDGNDRLVAGRSGDVVSGGDGNDTVIGLSGDDTLSGDDGNDLIYAGAASMLETDTTDGAGPTAFRNSLSGGDGQDTLVGAGGGDTLSGDAGADVLYGLAGQDSLAGGAGNDTLFGGSGGDWLSGGADNDSIDGGTNGNQDRVSGGSGDDMIVVRDVVSSKPVGQGQVYGDSGNDTIVATGGRYLINGGDGNDSISLTGTTGSTVLAGAGNDTIRGASGDTVNAGGGSNDVILGSGNDAAIFVYRDKIIGRDGNGDGFYGGADTINAGAGTDTLRVELSLDEFIDNRLALGQLIWTWSPGTVIGFLGSTFTNFENLLVTVNGFKVTQVTGKGGGVSQFAYPVQQSDESIPIQAPATDGDDMIVMSQVAEFDQGKTDKLGLAPLDVQADGFMNLRGGNDFAILADLGEGPAFLLNRTLYGDDGSDTLIGLGRADTISGGLQNDLIWGGAGNDSLLGDEGADTVDAGQGNDTITVFGTGDVVVAGDGDDWIITEGTIISGARLSGGVGNDIISISAGGGVSADGGDGNDTLEGWSSVGLVFDGGNGNDRLTTVHSVFGDAGGNDTVRGGNGDDTLVAGSGADYLDGGAGNDRLDGGDGNDFLTGGAGNDTLSGGDGDDSLQFGRDAFYGATFIDISNSRDTYRIDAVAEKLGWSADSIDGGYGQDTLIGTSGNDHIVGSRISGVEVFDGRSGNDLIDLRDYGQAASVLGGAGNDVLLGSAFADTLVGGLGDDTLRGGEGDDVFRFALDGSSDLVIDFKQGDVFQFDGSSAVSTSVVNGDTVLTVVNAGVTTTVTLANYVEQGNLIKNGSFEASSIVGVNYLGQNISSLEYWTTDESYNGNELTGSRVLPVYSVEQGGQGGKGSYCIELDSTANIDAISQTVVTQVGAQYNLSFLFAAALGSYVADRLDVLWNGEVVGTYISQESFDFRKIELTVYGSGSDTLTFRESAQNYETRNDAVGLLLDDVWLLRA